MSADVSTVSILQLKIFKAVIYQITMEMETNVPISDFWNLVTLNIWGNIGKTQRHKQSHKNSLPIVPETGQGFEEFIRRILIL